MRHQAINDTGYICDARVERYPQNRASLGILVVKIAWCDLV